MGDEDHVEDTGSHHWLASGLVSWLVTRGSGAEVPVNAPILERPCDVLS